MSNTAGVEDLREHMRSIPRARRYDRLFTAVDLTIAFERIDDLQAELARHRVISEGERI